LRRIEGQLSLPEGKGREALTVAELTRVIKGLVEGDPGLRDVWVEGELSNFKHHTSGHMYFTLKDEQATLRAVMFRGRNQALAFRPESGMRVYARGYVGIYERDGQYQLYVQELEPAGLGSLHLAFEQLKARLAAEGLFDQRLRRPLPQVPTAVGLITSPTGAALRDMVRVARRRWPGVRLVVIPVLVQGVEAPADIRRGLALAGGLGWLDVVILGRGGGSLEELWAFNDEGVARMIRSCPVPVVSAVGHETDFTIADFAADLRAPTPSAAAELVVPDRAHLLRHVDGLAARAAGSLRARLRRERQRLMSLRDRPALRHPRASLEAGWQRLDGLNGRLAAAWRFVRERRSERLGGLAARLEALSPLGVLSRGYAVCRRVDGGLVRSWRDVSVGEDVEVLLGEGRLDCRVQARNAGAAAPDA